jgi:hypothetical protein
MTLAARLRGLTARFDGQALQAFDAAAAQHNELDWPELRDWCLARPDQALAVAVPAPPALAMAASRAAAVGLDLDGTRALLDGRGALARLALRLQVKRQDLRGGMPPGRVWDSGLLPHTAAAHAALRRFVPRRPSFILVAEADPDEVPRLTDALRERSAGWTCPVRLLWLGPVPGAGWDPLPA